MIIAGKLIKKFLQLNIFGIFLNNELGFKIMITQIPLAHISQPNIKIP
jgi:hypothetical protein